MSKDLNLHEMVTLYFQNLPDEPTQLTREIIANQILKELEQFSPDEMQQAIPTIAANSLPITTTNLLRTAREGRKVARETLTTQSAQNFAERAQEASNREHEAMLAAAVPMPDRFKGLADKLRKVTG